MDDTQGAILLITVVERESHGNHVFQHLSRWLHVEHVRLDRPRPEPLDLDALFDSNGYVLVPGNLPVRIRNLVEENAPDSKEPISENRLDQRPDRLRVGQFPHLRRYVQQVADSEDPATLAHRSDVANMLQIW